MQFTQNWLQNQLNVSVDIQIRLLESVLVFISTFFLRTIFLWGVQRRIKNLRWQYRSSKSINYLWGITIIIWMGWIWNNNMQALLTFLGFFVAGIAIALREPISSFIGWLYILFRRTFEVGDRVEIDGHVGDVIDISLFQFTLLEVGNWVSGEQTSGRILHVPNNKVFANVFANYTDEFPYVWHEMDVVVSKDSDWEKARTLLLEILNQRVGAIATEASTWANQPNNHRFLVVYGKLTPIVYISVKSDGVHLALRYLSVVRQRRNSESAIWDDILRTFADEPAITLV